MVTRSCPPDAYRVRPMGVSRRTRHARRRRARVQRADNDLTPAEWAALCSAWIGCAYCGATDAALQKDCILAISRGGRYTLDNVVPACGSCNASKCNDEVTGWMRRKRLDEATFLVRHHQISASLLGASKALAPDDLA
jgi:5-methylcytosine-specific restriction endonuclease McrA